MLRSANERTIAFFIVGLIDNHPYLRFRRRDRPALRSHSACGMMIESLYERNSLRRTDGTERSNGNKALLRFRAIGTEIEVIRRCFEKSGKGNGSLFGNFGIYPNSRFSFWSHGILVLGCGTGPREGSAVRLYVTYFDAIGSFAVLISGKRETLHSVHIDTICLTYLVESNEDTLSFVRAEIYGELFPIGFPDTMGILRRRGCVIGINQRKGRGIGTIGRNLNTQLTILCIVSYACSEGKGLTCFGAQTRSDKPVFRSVGTGDNGTSETIIDIELLIVLFGYAFPFRIGIGVNR